MKQFTIKLMTMLHIFMARDNFVANIKSYKTVKISVYKLITKKVALYIVMYNEF